MGEREREGGEGCVTVPETGTGGGLLSSTTGGVPFVIGSSLAGSLLAGFFLSRGFCTFA